MVRVASPLSSLPYPKHRWRSKRSWVYTDFFWVVLVFGGTLCIIAFALAFVYLMSLSASTTTTTYVTTTTTTHEIITTTISVSSKDFLRSSNRYQNRSEYSSKFPYRDNRDGEEDDASVFLYHREFIDGIDVLWAMPPANDQELPLDLAPPISGLLFVAHGCQHSNTDWFPKSTASSCETCLGLPEERAIVRDAIDLGFVVIALSSTNRISKCWNVARDTEPVARVLKEFLNRFATRKQTDSYESSKEELLQQPLPIYAFGASSGGKFVSSIAEPLKINHGILLSGFISQISANSNHQQHRRPVESNEDSNDKSSDSLCQVYITMIRDSRTDDAARGIVDECNDNSSDQSATNRCKHIQLPALPMIPSYFSDRIPDISVAESSDMVRVFRDAGFLDEITNELREDPRQSNWRQTLLMSVHSVAGPSLEFMKRGDSLVADGSPISETMNVAWGFHEMTRDGVKEALEFCME